MRACTNQLCYFLVVDINECNGENKCDQKCKNEDGSYSCLCEPGFTLLSDNTSCKGTNNKTIIAFMLSIITQIMMSVKLVMVDVHNNASTLPDLTTAIVMMVLNCLLMLTAVLVSISIILYAGCYFQLMLYTNRYK